MKKTMKAVARVLAGAVIATALFATSASAHEARECIVFDARSGMIVDMLRASTDCSCAKPDYRNYAKDPQRTNHPEIKSSVPEQSGTLVFYLFRATTSA